MTSAIGSFARGAFYFDPDRLWHNSLSESFDGALGAE
jgi:hypothetical protein